MEKGLIPPSTASAIAILKIMGVSDAAFVARKMNAMSLNGFTMQNRDYDVLDSAIWI